MRLHCAIVAITRFTRRTRLRASTVASPSCILLLMIRLPHHINKPLYKKRGFIFCKEDRAILCRECDLSIHTTSDLTRQHTRYLLTGVQLSSVPISSTPTIVEEEEEVGDGSLYNVYNRDDAGASVSVLTETDSNVNTNNTQYFINAKYGWHVEEIMFNNAATTSTPAINIDPMFISSSQYYQQGEVNHHASHEGFPFWISQRQFFY
ncbi:B-box zinc finger protein 20-like isoform X3 [Carex rostrata]